MLTKDHAKAQCSKFTMIGQLRCTVSCQAIVKPLPMANGHNEGTTEQLVGDSPEAHADGTIPGGGMVGTRMGAVIVEVALAGEIAARALGIGKTIHARPVGPEHWNAASAAYDVLLQAAAIPSGAIAGDAATRTRTERT